ncbi:MAG TPA: 2-amino-4-hydroxy-6-hydroxymethyldihydropteridine diphosphokinase [Gammaproteobacteria bacterium]
MPTDVYIGVGSNIDPEQNVSAAFVELERRLGPIESSSAWRNPPVGFEGDAFLNLVFRAETALSPTEIEAILNEIEGAAGRVRDGRGPGPRSLDLDLLLYGTLVDPLLRLPHPDVRGYGFVLCPLAELAPDLVHPISGMSMKDEWLAMERGVTQLEKIEFEKPSREAR